MQLCTCSWLIQAMHWNRRKSSIYPVCFYNSFTPVISVCFVWSRCAEVFKLWCVPFIAFMGPNRHILHLCPSCWRGGSYSEALSTFCQFSIALWMLHWDELENHRRNGMIWFAHGMSNCCIFWTPGCPTLLLRNRVSMWWAPEKWEDLPMLSPFCIPPVQQKRSGAESLYFSSQETCMGKPLEWPWASVAPCQSNMK